MKLSAQERQAYELAKAAWMGDRAEFLSSGGEAKIWDSFDLANFRARGELERMRAKGVV